MSQEASASYIEVKIKIAKTGSLVLARVYSDDSSDSYTSAYKSEATDARPYRKEPSNLEVEVCDVTTFSILREKGRIDQHAAEKLAAVMEDLQINDKKERERFLRNAVEGAVNCHPELHRRNTQKIAGEGINAQYETKEFWNTEFLAKNAAALNTLAGGQTVFDVNALPVSKSKIYPDRSKIAPVITAGPAAPSNPDQVPPGGLASTLRTSDPAQRTPGAVPTGSATPASGSTTSGKDLARQAASGKA